jgi:hypothetical protein
MTKLKECPICGGSLVECWTEGRTLRQECVDCIWKGTPRIPEKQKIRTTKDIFVDQFNGFNYEIFDKYGCIMAHSKTYYNKKEAIKALKKDIEHDNKYPEYGAPVTGILWPDVITVTGEVFK